MEKTLALPGRMSACLVIVGAGLLVGCNNGVPVGFPIDPTADWSPSSDWAAAGERDPGDGGPGDEWDSGGYPDATSDTVGGYDAAPDPAWDAPMDTHADTMPCDAPSDPIAEDLLDTQEEDVEDEDVEDEDTEEDAEEDAPAPDAGDDAASPDASGSGGSPEPYVLYLSADDSNSQASPVIARSLIQEGRIVPWWLVRVYEFLNYYDMGYPAATQGNLAVTTQFRAINHQTGLYALQLGVRAPDLRDDDRRPVNLTLVLDTSGSMSGEPIDLEREVCRAIASSLRAGDVVSMLEWDTERSIHLSGHVVDGPDDPVLRAEIDGLAAGGGTNLHDGLVHGYDLATANYSPGYMNRVILVSDGQANVGVTDAELIAQHADDSEGEAIYLVGVGTGNGYNDTLMDTVTDAGRGAYVFIDSRDEAYKMFSERFVETIEVAAYEVQVELTLPGVFAIEEFHGEEYSTVPEEVTPQHLAFNDAMVFHQLLGASDPQAVYATDEIGVRVTWLDGPGGSTRTVGRADTLQELIDTSVPEMRKADAIVVYAQALMRIDAQLDAGEDLLARETCHQASGIVSESAVALADEDLLEISWLLDAYCAGLDTGSLMPTSWY